MRRVRHDRHHTGKDIADEALIAFAYDDIYSIEYFGEKLKSVWNKDGKTIETAISEAFGDYKLAEKAVELDDKYASRLCEGGRRKVLGYAPSRVQTGYRGAQGCP
ncbi:MAG: DUF5127 domain-containing protein [Eubacteriales bacterium]